VTVLLARRVAPGREEEFDAWQSDLTRVASHFQGFLGAGVLRPARAGEPWHVVYRFASPQALGVWEGSRERAGLLARADRLMATMAEHRTSGLETWFELPGRTAPAPPRWKMFVVSAVCIYALQFSGYAVPGGILLPWPLALRLAPVVLGVTAAMTWVVMPNVTRALQRWLYPRRPA
jgi:antibiotic biosynthesis monooxygenase (ABM) superfamily enzyme